LEFFGFSTLRNIQSSSPLFRFAWEIFKVFHSKSPSPDLSM
jgi:hypothetical protein